MLPRVQNKTFLYDIKCSKSLDDMITSWGGKSLCYRTGAIANLRQFAEQLWPINSKMTVYYNPNNPKKCYVDRPISKSFTSMMFIIMGTVTILSSVLVFFLMQL